MTTATGWTLDEYDRQPLPFIIELCEFWSEHPPVNMLVEAFVGFKSKKHRRSADYEYGDEGRKADMLPTPTNTVSQDAGLPEWIRKIRMEERVRKMALAMQKKEPAHA